MNGTAFLAIDFNQITRQFELFAANTVRTFIFAGIDMSRIFKGLQKSLYALCMALFGCADEIIVSDI